MEDEEKHFLHLKNLLEQFAKQENVEIGIEWFKNGYQFLENSNTLYAVVIFDIQIEGIDGLETAKRFCKVNNVSSIIFITSLAQYAQQGYEVDAISYLLKPVSYGRFALIFGKALSYYLVKEKCDFIIEIPGGV